jgi:hypothetical protein
MTEKEKRAAEQLKQHEDVRQALSQTGGDQQAVATPPARPIKTRRKVRIGTYVLPIICCG